MASDLNLPSGAALAVAKRRLLERLRNQTGGTVTSGANEIAPRPPRASAPLSFAQERLWFLQQWEPASAAYNVARAWRLKGVLDVALFERCLQIILQRHEVLRTLLVNDGDRPIQHVLPLNTPVLPVIDLRHLARKIRDQEIKRRITLAARHCFNLAAEPPLRVSLLQLDRQDYVFILATHQSACDGRSLDLFYRELEALYAKGGDAQTAAIAELPVQYGDYALWQRKTFDDTALASQFAYWKKQFGGELPVLELPLDRRRTATLSSKGARQKFVLDKTLTARLKELSARPSNTLFVTLMAAFNVLLQRYAHQDDIVVGFPVANRDRPGLENLIGAFVNTLALRSDLSGKPTFIELATQLRGKVQAALSHQELPFERLVDALQPVRDASRTPIFQTLFTFQNRWPAKLSLPGLRTKAIECDSGGAKYDLSLALGDGDGRISGFMEYRSELFAKGTIARMVQNFITLLKAIVAAPDQSIARLPVLAEKERRRLLVQWNQTSIAPPKARVTQLFEGRVRHTPTATALECNGKKLSYDQLNRRVNRLARYLKKLGVGRNNIIAICLERSADMVVTLLAVLKAGAAYLPLAPDYPAERLTMILTDAQASLLLTQTNILRSGHSRSLASITSVICLDERAAEIAKSDSRNLVSAVRDGDLAYVIYTSGSTGDPKGVQIEHRSLTNCLHAMRRQLSLTKRDVWLAVTTIAFDIAAAEIFLPLITGGKLVVASRDETRDGELLGHRLARCGATVMQATPSTWRLLLEAGWRGAKKHKMISGGETLPRSLADRLLERGAKLWNFYGPTETTIWATCCEVTAENISVPIGRPLANTQVYLLDGEHQPVPLGVAGELYLGGEGVARGYLNRPELNQERFIANPFVDDPDARLYRTGDLARYRADGNLEFLGRLDNQVKIRGFRVELGEIEAALCGHSGVRQCVVTANSENFECEHSLCAYVVPSAESLPDAGELQKYLRRSLPEFMVPTNFVVVDALPLTGNGKVDRKALAACAGRASNLRQELRPPRGECEELIAQIWRDVLRRDGFDAHDNFFDLGGHSLLAMRVAARLRSLFQIELPLRDLFELPTVARLAAHIAELRRRQSGAPPAPIVPVARSNDLPLSSAQQRLWYLHKLDSQSSAYNVPAAYRIYGAIDVAALRIAINAVTARHESLRTAIIERDGQPRQRILPTVELSVPVVAVAATPAEDVDTVILQRARADAQLPYDLSCAPLMRATLLRLGERDHLLLLNFHHIIIDATSLANFYGELAQLYDSARLKTDPALQALRLQFADFASWQQEWLDGPAAQTSLAYWKHQLAGALPPLELPVDYPRPAHESYFGARVSRGLSRQLTAGLEHLACREAVTLFMTLLAGLNILLARLSGRGDIIVGSTSAGRNRAELDDMIGFFINPLALRVDVSGNPTFSELLKRVREICLDGYSHQDLPFDRIVDALHPARESNRNPLFQVMFNMNQFTERDLKLSDCRAEKILQSDATLKFDLVLYAPKIDGAIELALVYNAELFCQQRMTSFLEQLSLILEQAVAAPDKSVDSFSLLTASTRSTLPDPLLALGDRWEGSVPALVSRQAKQAGGGLAVVDASGAWNYREVDERSSQLAHYLVQSGIEPGDVVAIHARRGASLVIAMLGALKAGAPFVVLDPAYPAARLVEYLRIARPKGWLQLDATVSLPSMLSVFLDQLGLCCRLSLGADKQEIAAVVGSFADDAPDITVSADDPAYVAFTSGSTGQPKGVLCRHGPMSHFLPWQQKLFDLQNSDRYCLLSGLGYNHLQREIFTALTSGAALYIPTPAQVRAPDELLAWLREQAITVLHLTPALGRMLASARIHSIPSLRRIFFGGDLLTRHDAAAMRQLAPNAKIVSFYGATETQRAVGYYDLDAEEKLAERQRLPVVPTGKGAPDVQLLLLTPRGQLAGVGELAELHVRSPHLAAGYVDDAELTKANFIVNPCTNDPCDRLYRTGELARYRPDGTVEWVGRRDRRVSVRGFRVDLSEVESSLSQHPSVRAVAVTSDTDKSDAGLLAYVVAKTESVDLSVRLREFLLDRLPHYMVPAEFIFLDCLPLNPHGKVDYGQLPAPRRRGVASGYFESPSSAVENRLAAIFAEVLGVERIGRRDDFFQLGGHSLLAAQAAARIRENFAAELDLRTFLAAPTVAALARHLDALAVLPSADGDTDSRREELEI